MPTRLTATALGAALLLAACQATGDSAAVATADADAAFALVSLRPDETTLEILSHEALLFSRATNFTASPDPAPADSSDPAAPPVPRPESLSLVQHAARETLRSATLARTEQITN